MEEVGFITAAERETAAQEKLNFHRPGSEHLAPYFVEYVRQLLVAKYGESMVYKGGLQIYTTLNLEMQKAAETAFLSGIRELDKREGWRGSRRTVDLATFQPSQQASSDQPLKSGSLGEGVVLRVAKDHYVVQVGAFTAKLAFDDLILALLGASEPSAVKGSTCGKLSLNIRANGDVTPCGFIPVVIGNLLVDDLKDLWDHSNVLERMRNKEPREKCKTCKHYEDCLGGCTARAFAIYGDFNAPDPHCWMAR